MLTNLKIRLEPEKDIKLSQNMSSNIHGALMELIDPEYADMLHQEGLRPYSQYLSFEDGRAFWNINSLNTKAFEKIIKPLLEEQFTQLHIEHHDLKLKIMEKQLSQLSDETVTEKFYFGNSSRIFKIRFVSPTAFKQNGKYTFYPDLGCLYGSLMRRYDFANDKESFFDEELLEQLTDNSSIIQYNLRSTKFHLEGVKVPAFTGWILIKVNGPQTMSNYINMLMHFGEFSGVGIKTALGMGAMRLEEQEGKNDRRTH